MKNKRFAIFLTILFSFLLAAPAAAYAATEPPAGAAGGTMTVEYRYAEGETPDVLSEISRYGFTYRLVSQSEPVLESELPATRTYSYRVSGALTQEQLDQVRGIENLTLTPVNIVMEREVDKTVTLSGLATNDVDDIPMARTFSVTSGTAAGGTEVKTLDRAAVTFEIEDVPTSGEDAGLPAEYIATVVYRGVESYAELGYYLAEATFTTSVTGDNVPVYIIVAEYATDEMPPIVDSEPIPDPETPDASLPLSGLSDDDLERISNQGSNPLQNIMDGNVPLGGLGVIGGWSFLSSLFAMAAFILAIAYAIKAAMKKRHTDILGGLGVHDEEWLALIRRRGNILRALTIILGIMTLLIWIIFDNFSVGMTWVNAHTLPVGVLFLITIVLCILTNLRDRKPLEALSEDEATDSTPGVV